MPASSDLSMTAGLCCSASQVARLNFAFVLGFERCPASSPLSTSWDTCRLLARSSIHCTSVATCLAGSAVSNFTQGDGWQAIPENFVLIPSPCVPQVSCLECDSISACALSPGVVQPRSNLRLDFLTVFGTNWPEVLPFGEHTPKSSLIRCL
jgi:hypothetical protein